MASDRYRALVVDDEVAIQRLTMVALRKQGFDCDGAEDGAQASQLAAASRYDVVITDLKMPNKNGHSFALDLLSDKNRPLIVVHTGVIEPRLANDLLVRGVDDVMFKPTDIGFLAAKVKALVERHARAKNQQSESSGPVVEKSQAGKQEILQAASEEGPISLSQLNQQLSRVSTVLPVSNAALDVYKMTHGDRWRVPQIAAAIQRDPALATDVLRLANSSLYNPSGRRMVSLDEAVLRIGQRRVGELALAANALAALAPALLPWMDLELAWKRSMAAGIALETLVELGGHQEIEEGLLLSAIMHPLGRVALGMLFPKQYLAMTAHCNQSGDPLREQERQMFPTNHTEVMAHLLASWQIPADVFLPLKYSLDDFSLLARLSEPARTKTELVKVAIVLGRLAVGRWESWDLVQLPAPRVLKRLRLANVGRVVQQTKSDLSKLADFHPGDVAAKHSSAPSPAKRAVAYCNPSDREDDLLVELIPSTGLQPECCSVEDLQDYEETAILNCLGAASGRFMGRGGWANAIIVTDQESREIFEPFAETAALPESYARFCDMLLNAVIGRGLKRQDLAAAPS